MMPVGNIQALSGCSENGCGTRNWTWLIGLWTRLVTLTYRIALCRALGTLVELEKKRGGLTDPP